MAEHLILSLLDFEEKDLSSIRQIAGGLKVMTLHDLGCSSADEIPKEIWADAAVILGDPSPAQLSMCENLKLLQLKSAGADQYCMPGVLTSPPSLWPGRELRKYHYPLCVSSPYPLQPDISDWSGIAHRLAFRNHPYRAGVSWRTIMQLENLPHRNVPDECV